MAVMRRWTACGLLVVVLCGVAAARPAAAGGLPAELQDVGERWLEENWSSIVEKRTHLITAYEIGADDMEAFLHLYYSAWRGYRDHHIRFAESISIDDSPEEAHRKLIEFDEQSPVRDTALMVLVESILPPRDVVESRSRFIELNEAATAQRYKEQDVALARYELSRAFNARGAATAFRDRDGRPIPRHESVALGLTAGDAVKPGEILYSPETVAEPAWVRPVACGVFHRPVARVTPIVKSINDAETLAKVFPRMTSDASDRPLIDPAEDDWLKGAHSALDSYCASAEARLCDRAEALLDEMVRRAWIVRRLKADAYLALESLTSRRAFSEALAELDDDLDGLRTELSARLSGLRE